MFIAEYQTQQIQYLYAFFAFAISSVKHKEKGTARYLFLWRFTISVGFEAALRKRSGGAFLAVTVDESCAAGGG